MSKLKRTLLIALGSLVLLFGVLVWHVHLVTRPKPTAHLANIQLARIDFLEPLSYPEASTIRRAIAALPGVQHARVNLEDQNVVYSYDRAVQDQQAVFTMVNDLSSVPCARLVVTAEAAASGCPAMAKGDAQDRLGRWIAGLLH